MSKRVLIINANWLGDALFSTPAIRALRKKFPDCHLACLAPPRVGEVLKSNPHLNELIVYHDRVSLFNVWENARLAREIKKRNFDQVIFFHRSKTKAFLAKLAGVPERIGYQCRGRDQYLTHRVKTPKEALHKIDYFLNLLKQSGIEGDGRAMEFFPDPAAQGRLRDLLAEHDITAKDRYAVVHAGGNWDLKRWPSEHFAESIRLMMRDLHLKVVLCGAESEKKLGREICSNFAASHVVSLCGETSLDMLAYLLRQAEFLLSNDSGPIHLAATQKTKIIGLFGPTSPALTGPVSLGALRILHKDVGCEVPCYFRSCNYRVCMDWITPKEVIGRAEELLRE